MSDGWSVGQTWSVQRLDGDEHEFRPFKELSDKRNFSRHAFVRPDGTIDECIRLNVLDDRFREDLIAYHFCQSWSRMRYPHLGEQPQFYVVGRDNPWDLQYVLHDGSGFNLEICRIASQDLLKCIKIENDCEKILSQSEAFGYQIRKVEKHFPGTFEEDLLKRAGRRENKERKFPLPAESSGPRIFMRPSFDPHVNVQKAIKKAINSKAEKKHQDKNETILILDNLTTHAKPADFFEAIERLKPALQICPFNSIWVYTGYYSDNDGGNCEYGLISIYLDEFTKRELISGQNLSAWTPG